MPLGLFVTRVHVPAHLSGSVDLVAKQQLARAMEWAVLKEVEEERSKPGC